MAGGADLSVDLETASEGGCIVGVEHTAVWPLYVGLMHGIGGCISHLHVEERGTCAREAEAECLAE